MLIAIEGIDGTGKTTVAKFLRDELEKMGYRAVLLREPTNSEWGIKIKKSMNARLSADEELKLFILDRKYNVEKNILPALRSGKIVIMDRYYYSTIAYQGARGIDIEEIKRMNDFAPEPDVVILLDAPPDLCIERIKKRGERNSFERLSYLKKVREIFKSLNDKLVIVNASKSVGEVKKEVLDIVLKHMR